MGSGKLMDPGEGDKALPSSPGKQKLIDNLMTSEVQRLRALLQETESTASLAESELKQQCGELQGKVQQLQSQLECKSPAVVPYASVGLLGDNKAQAEHILTLVPQESVPLFSMASGTDFRLEEGEEEDFWELSVGGKEEVALGISRDEVASTMGSVVSAATPAEEAKQDADGEEVAVVAAAHTDGKDSSQSHERVNDTAMEDDHRKLRVNSSLAQEKEPSPTWGLASEWTEEAPQPTKQPQEVPVPDLSDDGSSSGSSTYGDPCGGEQLGIELDLHDIQTMSSLEDASSLGGYTFSKEDMEQLQSHSDALQTLVVQLSAALEQADDDRYHLEQDMRKAVARLDSGGSPGLKWTGLLPRIRSIPKAETRESELLRSLDESRGALQQSTEVQTQLKQRVSGLRSAGEALRNALAATESELQLYKAKVAALEQSPGKEDLSTFDHELRNVEHWRREAKKAVEATYASLPDQRDTLDHLDWAPSDTVREVATLREENADLSAALAQMSVQFAEADSEHMETKRALARTKFRLATILDAVSKHPDIELPAEVSTSSSPDKSYDSCEASI